MRSYVKNKTKRIMIRENVTRLKILNIQNGVKIEEYNSTYMGFFFPQKNIVAYTLGVMALHLFFGRVMLHNLNFDQKNSDICLFYFKTYLSIHSFLSLSRLDMISNVKLPNSFWGRH